MRKIYKPIARTEKASQMYRKKTLNVTDNLNIQHDDNDIEDLDEYWEAAQSVIGNKTLESIDDTVVTEQSDTLFNIKTIRKSLKAESKKIKEDSAPKEIRKSLKAEIKKIKEDSAPKENSLNEEDYETKEDKTKTVSDKKDEKDNSKFNSTSTLKKRLTLKPDDESLPDSVESRKEEAEYFAAEEDCFSVQSAECDDSLKLVNSSETIKISEDKNNENENNMMKLKHVRKTKPVVKKAESRSNSLIIENTKGSCKKNKVQPLVCTETMNTAMMSLDYKAYIKNERALNPFSLFVIKGKIEIRSNNTSKIMKNGEATVISRNQVYSIDCISENGASLFVSYVL